MLVLTQKPNDRVVIYYKGERIGFIQNAGKSKSQVGLQLPPEFKILRESLELKK